MGKRIYWFPNNDLNVLLSLNEWLSLSKMCHNLSSELGVWNSFFVSNGFSTKQNLGDYLFWWYDVQNRKRLYLRREQALVNNHLDLYWLELVWPDYSYNAAWSLASRNSETTIKRYTNGTPQGSVLSPTLLNIFIYCYYYYYRWHR